jgi:hypothetical protein
MDLLLQDNVILVTGGAKSSARLPDEPSLWPPELPREQLTLPPSDSPKIVTLPGSPPNVLMLSRTHSKTATMASVATFAALASSSPA